MAMICPSETRKSTINIILLLLLSKYLNSVKVNKLTCKHANNQIRNILIANRNPQQYGLIARFDFISLEPSLLSPRINVFIVLMNIV